MEIAAVGIHTQPATHAFVGEAVSARQRVTTPWGWHQVEGISKTWETWRPVGLHAGVVHLVIVQGVIICLEDKHNTSRHANICIHKSPANEPTNNRTTDKTQPTSSTSLPPYIKARTITHLQACTIHIMRMHPITEEGGERDQIMVRRRRSRWGRGIMNIYTKEGKQYACGKGGRRGQSNERNGESNEARGGR